MSTNNTGRGINFIFDYILEVKKEMSKVSWPVRQELISNTVITLVATVVISLFIFFSDRVISGVLKFVYQ